jgi:phage tail-like protein
MIPQDFKTQIIRKQNQWGSGLLYRLEMQKEDGITLYPMPTFVMWIQEVENIKNPCCLAVDECGQIYFVDGDTCRLYYYDPAIQRLEQISCIGGRGSDIGEFIKPRRIIFDKFSLWVLDSKNKRILAFSRENFQIKYIIEENLTQPIDIGLDELGHLYVLDKKENQISILVYDTNGNIIKKHFDESCLKDLGEPVGLAAGRENTLYVIDRKGFFKFTKEGKCSGIIGDFSKIPFEPSTKPSSITIDKKGNIFAIDDKTGSIHQFDPDGSHIGKILIPEFKDKIHGIAIDSKNNLFASSSKGIAFFNTEQTFTKEKGFYYSKTLDSGIHECRWHRLAMKADIPPGAIIEIYYHSSDNQILKNRIDEILKDPEKSTQEKTKDIDDMIPEWTEPETLHGSKEKTEKNEKDMLFRKKTGRYLWLKIVLLTFDEKVRPSITQMKIFYPRISYLRYLPAVYQEDPTSREFLERFLSIFETIFYNIETEISNIFRYFDPDTVPQDFLTWLASWLNVALEEGWQEDKKRQFIREAYELYKQKGTPSGIERLIEIYTGKKPELLEHSKIGKPMILRENGAFRLGINSLLTDASISGFRLGDEAILGRVALRETVHSHEEPFLSIAHRFTIRLDLSDEEIIRFEKGLRRIVDEEKPAHTMYSLRFLGSMKEKWAYVGINTKLDSHKSIKLGAGAIGSGILAGDKGKGGRVEQQSRIGLDTELI